MLVSVGFIGIVRIVGSVGSGGVGESLALSVSVSTFCFETDHPHHSVYGERTHRISSTGGGGRIAGWRPKHPSCHSLV